LKAKAMWTDMAAILGEKPKEQNVVLSTTLS